MIFEQIWNRLFQTMCEHMAQKADSKDAKKRGSKFFLEFEIGSYAISV